MLVAEEYCPKSWYTEKGRAKIVRELLPRLPDVSGMLFVTLTVDPKMFDSEESAFDKSRDKIRRVIDRLRSGVTFEGEVIRIKAEYFVKVEFHQNGWVHYHLLLMTRRFLDKELLRSLWGYGRTHIDRIENNEFLYLLKYVAKGCDWPEWVKSKKRLRVVQASRGFYKKNHVEDPLKDTRNDIRKRKKKRASFTIRERLERHQRTALVVEINEHGKRSGHTQILLPVPYWNFIDENIIELVGTESYLGRGRIQIKNKREIEKWKNQNR